ncbi:MAG: SPFH domain-containing protein [Candidatus Methanomethylophilaceae archaeon]|nr:SPFH domain-containing protein [Candidatus Methanomethylophilaceae archaeon]MDY5872365.1 SPFH domain-containing protein [Candidatus Methanomethylophilaceae archaeon]
MEAIIPILAVVVLLAAIISVLSGVKIVQPYEQAVYMRLGKYVRILNQGLNVVCPLINQVVKMDLRTQVLDVPRQEVITKDNSPVNVDAIIYIKVTDPKNAFFEVTDYRTATIYLAQTTLRSIIGEMELDQILSNREKINIQLRDILDESTDKWGVKIEAVEIREVDPALKVKESMEEQTSAERRRRAAILEADGMKTAAVLEAEGKKRSMILEAEGKKKSMVLEAEGKRLATILEAQGEAQKLRLTSVGAASLDSKGLAVLSMETLKTVGDGQASKIYFPMELTKVVEGISSYLGTSNDVPEREVAERKDIEDAVGRPEDVLGSIPSPDEIRESIEMDDDSPDDRSAAEAVKKAEREAGNIN